MQTQRDAQIVEWLGRMGAAGAEHVGERFGLHVATVYRRFSVLKAACLIEHHQPLYQFPGMYSATREGLRWRGLERFLVFEGSPGMFEHTWRQTGAAVVLHRELLDWELLSEREIRARELDETKLVVSAQLGPSSRGPRHHRADLALVSPSGRVTAIEIELNEKGPAALKKICGAWSRARHVDHVYYLASAGPGRGVSRVVQGLKADDRITVLELDDVTGIAERELAREREPRHERGSRREPGGERALAREPESQELWQFPGDDALQPATEEAEDVLGA
jgi:hypothetical protein